MFHLAQIFRVRVLLQLHIKTFGILNLLFILQVKEFIGTEILAHLYASGNGVSIISRCLIYYF